MEVGDRNSFPLAACDHQGRCNVGYLQSIYRCGSASQCAGNHLLADGTSSMTGGHALWLAASTLSPLQERQHEGITGSWAVAQSNSSASRAQRPLR